MSSAGPCPVCAGAELRVFLERPGVPVHQNMPLPTAAEARSTARGDLRLACCEACGFITNTAFRQELLAYGSEYENDQTCSGTFDAYVDSLVDRLLARGVRDVHVAEIGCGNGYFLRRLCDRGHNRGSGFDPSYAGPLTTPDGAIRFVRAYFGPDHVAVKPDVVVCRHVIEHVPRPVELLRSVREALAGAPGARLFFETPAVDWILEGGVIQDFFYEHCSYFTAGSLAHAFERAALKPVRSERTFGDQYLWIEADNVTPAAVAARPDPALGRAAARYAEAEGRTIARLREGLERLAGTGPVAVWGAGAKGVTFGNLMDPDATRVDCVVDINPRKQGRFVPGTGHAILGPDALGARGIRHVVVMNPNYVGEIRAEVAARAPALSIAIHAEGDSVKFLVDTDKKTLVLAEESRELPLYSPESFSVLSRAWAKVGWGLKYAYGFSWMGRPIIQLPEDIVRIQEVIYRVRPDVLVETGVAHGGSLVFYASLFEAMGRGRVIGVDIEIRPANRTAIEEHPLARRIALLEGSSVDPQVVARVRGQIAPGERVLVLLDSNHTKAHVAAELEAYGPLVSAGSYIVATDGIMQDLHDAPGGKPEWRGDNPSAAAIEFAARHPEWVLETPAPGFGEALTDERVTYWPSAYLRRT